jgi:hypothetical protein
MEYVKKFWRDQEGVVESALVIIPLMALFLIAIELIVVVNFRNMDLTYAQSAAATEAISSVVPSSDEVISFSSPHSFDELRLVVTHRARLLPRLIPALPFLNGVGTPSTDVSGIAVMERRP